MFFITLHSDINVESGVFVGCDFETSTCEWKDIIVGQFVWERDQNGTTTAKLDHQRTIHWHRVECKVFQTTTIPEESSTFYKKIQ